jgi:hypothetical protein
MAITITLDDDLVAGLDKRAKKQQLSVEHFAIHVLTKAVEESESATPRETVLTIQAIAPNSSQVRPATTNLAELLRASPGDPSFDLDSWNRQWSKVEAEMKAITRANDVAESRGG